MATDDPSRAPDERALEEAIHELEQHLLHLRRLLEQMRAGEQAEPTDWSVFDAEPRDGSGRPE